MAGLYIHIPFCKSRCIYCGFYSTTHGELQQRYVEAVCREMARSKKIIENSEKSTVNRDLSVETIYLGGGTPSQLTDKQLHQLFDAIAHTYGLTDVKEVTIECNPDDITEEYAAMLSQLPVNRVSMGVQTFSNERLRFLHRRHTAEQIPVAVERLHEVGIRNISIDLMYGFPGETLSDWEEDIRKALELGVEHLSAYCLMYEEGTALYRLLEKGAIEELDEELERQMYATLIDQLTSSGYEHYEISNFARPGYRSRHNSSYWNQTPYIGLGAAAHSYNGSDCRRWNMSDAKAYTKGIEKGEPVFDYEILDEDTRYNDLVMTALRTCEGLDLRLLTAPQKEYCLQQAKRFVEDGLLQAENDYLTLTRKGLFVSNMVMSELMKV